MSKEPNSFSDESANSGGTPPKLNRQLLNMGGKNKNNKAGQIIPTFIPYRAGGSSRFVLDYFTG